MQRLEVIAKFFLALASSVLIFISGVALPALGVVLLPFVVQPALVFGLKYGTAGGVGVLCFAIVLLALFAGEELAYIYSIFALMAGLLFVLLGRLKVIEYLVVGITTLVFGVTLSLGLHFFGSWTAMSRDFHQSLLHQITAALRVHEKMGLPQESLEVLKDRSPQIVETMLALLPALVFLSLALMVLINILLLCRRFPERRPQWLSIGPLREWKGPEQTVWGLILCGFSFFIPGLDDLHGLALNLLLLIGACYFAQGLAVIAYFFHKNKVPRFLRGITYLLIVFQQIFTLLVVGLGLFDLWGNFRQLGKDNLTPSQAA
jgi:uncharacterized protein YybS (DUF2232 family)